ncbi:hypothetical protein FHS07_002039 [Microbacterium proteolyticum]|uniref:Uncharacterized protein n=1 Tax=Microbacterium proteolyticum TaxID=1572644 RepID=A0A7W5CII3_9MICO|nr:hypothetical protein [Microbacterium proteolyticum]
MKLTPEERRRGAEEVFASPLNRINRDNATEVFHEAGFRVITGKLTSPK